MSVHINRFVSLLIALFASCCLNQANVARAGSEPLYTVMQLPDVMTRRAERLKKLFALQNDPKLQVEISVVGANPAALDLVEKTKAYPPP